MTISETRGKCKALIGRIPRDVLVISVVILASTFSFGLGYLVGRDTAEPAQFTLIQGQSGALSHDAQPAQGKTGGKFVASKNGSKYYLSQCAGAGRISDANKIWFESAAAAREAGYSPAANCPGI